MNMIVSKRYIHAHWVSMCNMCCTQITCTCSTLYFQALVLLLSASDVMVLHCSLYALIGLAQRLALCRDQFKISYMPFMQLWNNAIRLVKPFIYLMHHSWPYYSCTNFKVQNCAGRQVALTSNVRQWCMTINVVLCFVTWYPQFPQLHFFLFLYFVNSERPRALIGELNCTEILLRILQEYDILSKT